MTKTYGAEPVDISEFGITVTDGSGLPVAAPGAITLSVRDNAVAEVAADGKLKINNAGTAVVTVTVAETDTYAQQTATVYLTVQKKSAHCGEYCRGGQALCGQKRPFRAAEMRRA